MSTVVVLGRTYADAKDARAKHVVRLPDLDGADVASTYAFRVVDGRRVTKVYVAPGTRETSKPDDYRRCVLVLSRDLRKTPGADPVLHQILENGSTEPVDVEQLRTDPL